MKTPRRRSWTCPRCGHRFVSANVWHSCGRHRLADHFRVKDPAVRRLFDRFKGLVRRHGPVTDHRTFRRVETVAPRSHVHYFRLQEPGDLDPGLAAIVKAAAAVGRREHLRTTRRGP